MAFSVVVPSVNDDDKINKIIAKRAIHAYAELEKHSKNKNRVHNEKIVCPFFYSKLTFTIRIEGEYSFSSESY